MPQINVDSRLATPVASGPCLRQVCGIALSVLALLASLPAAAAEATQATGLASAEGPVQRLRFDYHSSFLMNLHHFLLDASRRKPELAAEQAACRLEPTELAPLNEARAFYAEQFEQRHPLFDAGLAAIKQALRQAEDGRRDAQGLRGLPEHLALQLSAAAPAYGRCVWPAHEASNRRWIEQAQALDTRFGAAVQARLERQFTQPFTRLPLRTDLVHMTGTYEGAYSSDEPEHVLMPSGRPDYQGDAALEMLYHEASHVGVMRPLFRSTAAALKATPRPNAQLLWHAMQFYTVGLAVQEVLRQDGEREYTPYAVQGGLYRRTRWQHALPAIEAHWLPWLRQGRPGFSEAVEAVVQALPMQPVSD
ncbi:hypothetical protein LNV23_05695 [Paucibacter sp. DJ1R-11]|uniref:hypothetical protein n=1 Tax=Paucibacter sp. DJ1R-11 TaxID=2893556 RepID=UPI0021E41270|nr:hypothetical protein [Paucibacter sp. DJ1R-11]MCV2362945.1 hypothetical protein [Paucibacter sp. DJ1R-11]